MRGDPGQDVLGSGSAAEVDATTGLRPLRHVDVLVPQAGDGPTTIGVEHLLALSRPERRSHLGDPPVGQADVDGVTGAGPKVRRSGCARRSYGNEPDTTQKHGASVACAVLLQPSGQASRSASQPSSSHQPSDRPTGAL